MKIIFLFPLTLMVFLASASAQPFIYKLDFNFDTTEVVVAAGISTSSKITRINLNDGSATIVFDSLSVEVSFCATDQGNNLLLIDTGNEWEFFNLPDLSLKLSTVKAGECPTSDFLYSADKNEIWIFTCSPDYSDNELVYVDLNNGKYSTLLSIPDKGYGSPDIFFSRDKGIIYFSIPDTTSIPPSPALDKIIFFSTNSKKIVMEKYLSEFGYKGADAYQLNKGREGKGIIQSIFYNKNHECYLRLYDFDTDSGSHYISHPGYTIPYLLGEKYLILAEDTLKDSYLTYTGKIFCYNSADDQLIKSFSLPAGGEVYTFDNYPDDLYYVVDIDSPGRRIFRINADSLLSK